MSNYRAIISVGVLALILLGGSNVVGAELERLFFSPKERSELDRLRNAALAPPPAVVEVPESPSVVIEPPDPVVELPKVPLTVDGYVKRTKGPATVWLNGVSNYDGIVEAQHVSEPLRGSAGLKVRVVPDGAAIAVTLKPGQTFDPNTETTRDAYEVDRSAARGYRIDP